METRPRRSHHRPLLGKLDTRSLPLPKQLPPTIAAALQSGPGRVWTPVLVRDQPWISDSASRSHLSSSCWGFFGFLVFGLSPVPGLAFPVVSAPCARGRARGGACVCVFVFRAWAFAFLRCLCCCGGPFGAGPWVSVGWRLARVGFPVPFLGVFSPDVARHTGGWVSVGWRLARVGFPVPFLGVFSPDVARHTGGRTSPRFVRISFGSPQS